MGEESVSEMNQSERRTDVDQSENITLAPVNVPPKQIEPIMSDSGVSVSSQKMMDLEDQIIRQNTSSETFESESTLVNEHTVHEMTLRAHQEESKLSETISSSSSEEPESLTEALDEQGVI